MKRSALTVTAALLTTVGVAAPANAWPMHPQLTREQAISRVELCAGNPLAGLCTDGALTARAQTVMFAYDAGDTTAAAICDAHRARTHTWRMGFCRGVIYQDGVAHDLSTLGVLDRASLMHGFKPSI
jgi:hypothetical protein